MSWGLRAAARVTPLPSSRCLSPISAGPRADQTADPDKSTIEPVLLAGRPGAGWEVGEAAGSAPGLLSAPLKFTHLIRATLSERGREGNREAAFLPLLALPRGGYGGTPWEGPPPTKDSDPQHLLSCPDPAPHACSTHSLTPSPAGGACYTTTPITPSANVCLLSTCC